MLRALKVRLYPTAEQERCLRGLHGAVRFVWNYALRLKRHYYRTRGVSLRLIKDVKPLIAVAKRHQKYAWLAEYDSMALQQAVINLDKAYANFYAKRANFPRFRSKRGEQSSYHCTAVYVLDDAVQIPKMTPIRAKIHRPVNVPAERIDKKGRRAVNSITLTRDNCGDYWASILYDDGIAKPETARVVDESGVTAQDMGLASFTTDSNGRKVECLKAYKRALKKLARAQRALSRKKKGSKNREKARRRFAKLNRRVARQRADFLHKQSRKIVDESQAMVFETLRIRNMVKNHHLAGAILDAGWGTYVRMVEYKAERAGKPFVKVDAFFPSSKRCSVCGKQLSKLSLNCRGWVCPFCGAHHDRDVNAAKNLKQEAIRILRASGLYVRRA